MEGHVDTGERDGRVAALKLKETVLLLGLLDRLDGLAVALVDDLAEHLLDLLESELLGELWDRVRSDPLDRMRQN